MYSATDRGTLDVESMLNLDEENFSQFQRRPCFLNQKGVLYPTSCDILYLEGTPHKTDEVSRQMAPAHETEVNNYEEIPERSGENVRRSWRIQTEQRSLLCQYKNQNNLAKKIVPNFRKYALKALNERNSRLILAGGHEYIRQSIAEIDQWITSKEALNLRHLEVLFGNGTEKCYYNSYTMQKILQRYSLEIVTEGKVQNIESYLFGLEKYASKLVNPIVSRRVQAK